LYPPPTAAYTSDYYQPYVTSEDSLPRFIARHVHDGRSTSSGYRYVSQLREIEGIMSKFTVRNSRRLLDVGCGMGGFLIVARELGFEVHGTEISEHARKFCHDHLGLDVVAPESLEQISGQFDVITIWHVLEHVMDPKNFISMYLAKLRSGGLVVIEVPNWSSFMSRVRKSNWRFIRKDHLIYFTPDSLVYLLNMLRVEVVKGRTTGSLGLTQHLEHLWKYAGEFIKHHPSALPIKKTYLHLMSASKLGDFYRIFALKKEE